MRCHLGDAFFILNEKQGGDSMTKRDRRSAGAKSADKNVENLYKLPRGVSKQDLGGLYYLKKEIELQKRRIKELEAKAASCNQPITDLPSDSRISDKVGNYAAQIADLKNLLDRNCERRMCELNILERYIQSVDDPLIRQIMQFRFAKGYRWSKIAWKVDGNNSIDALKKKLYRFLEKN